MRKFLAALLIVILTSCATLETGERALGALDLFLGTGAVGMSAWSFAVTDDKRSGVQVAFSVSALVLGLFFMTFGAIKLARAEAASASEEWYDEY